MTKLIEYVENIDNNHPSGGYFYKLADVLFKYIQWISLAALIKTASEQINSDLLGKMHILAVTVITVSMSESITRIIDSVLQQHRYKRAYIFIPAIVVSCAISIYMSYEAKQVIDALMDDFAKFKNSK